MKELGAITDDKSRQGRHKSYMIELFCYIYIPIHTLVHSLAYIEFTSIHLCFQLTQAIVELDLIQSNLIGIYNT